VQEIKRLTPTGRTAKREPNVNFWNYKKCVTSGGEMQDRQRAGITRFDLDPDVSSSSASEQIPKPTSSLLWMTF
jgi:hypothetical protein